MMDILNIIINNWEAISLGILNVLQFLQNRSLKKVVLGGYNE
nr:MAG: hypothetical protein [Microvirus sp.]